MFVVQAKVIKIVKIRILLFQVRHPIQTPLLPPT